ncbi:MAG: PucR family transcriptional regulator ligand-binding domain-containing protein [Sporomusaceae bacterium]|nr:PucR family transcriptional regulator ligand-binding domain-containing protein [Sporomusaceae bacterium]
MISYQKILQLRSLQKAKLVAGEAGLNKLVRWVHFIDLPDVLPWVQGGELLIITGIGLQGDKDRLQDLIHGIIQKNLAGLIVNVGPYIEAVSKDILVIADEAGFPIFELPWEVRLVEVTQEICSLIVTKHVAERSVSDFLEQLLLKPIEQVQELFERSSALHYDLTVPQQVGVISLQGLAETSFLQTEAAEQSRVILKMQIEQTARSVLTRQNRTTLSMTWLDTIVLLLPAVKVGSFHKTNEDLLSEIAAELRIAFPQVKIAAGLGKSADSPIEIRRSYHEASKALLFGEYSASSESIYLYEQLGIFKLLLDLPQETLYNYYKEVMEPLLAYDRKYKSDLVTSLYVFFEENGNAVQTAKRLFVHRNTLDYRLKKIEDVTGRNLANPYERLTLQVGALIHRQLFGAESS